MQGAFTIFIGILLLVQVIRKKKKLGLMKDGVMVGFRVFLLD